MNFGNAFPDKHDKGHIGDSADPGIANQLRIEREQAFGFFGVAAGRRFPVDQATLAIELTDGIYVGNEFISVRSVLVSLTCSFRWDLGSRSDRPARTSGADGRLGAASDPRIRLCGIETEHRG